MMIFWLRKAFNKFCEELWWFVYVVDLDRVVSVGDWETRFDVVEQSR